MDGICRKFGFLSFDRSAPQSSDVCGCLNAALDWQQIAIFSECPDFRAMLRSPQPHLPYLDTHLIP